MYELIDLSVQKRSLNEELKEITSSLCKHLNFDSWKIIMFNADKLYGFLHCSSETEAVCPSNTYNQIIFDKSRDNSYLGLLLTEGKAIFCKYEKEIAHKYTPISPEKSSELYYPLISSRGTKKEILGCLYFAKQGGHPGDLNNALLDDYLQGQVINIQSLFEIIYNSYLEDRGIFDLIHLFQEIIVTKEPFMKNHPYNVAFLSNSIGQELGFSSDQLYKLNMAALLHDIGKICLNDSILNKTSPLAEAEKKELNRHPLYGYIIIRDLATKFDSLSGIEDIVLQHHERFDGKGYPKGIKGEDILLESRILAIADAVDAMLSERSYKKPKNLSSTINQLISNKGTQFDPKLAQIMVEILVKGKKGQRAILEKPITLGTLELLTEEKSCQIQGTLIKTIQGYRFKKDFCECTCDECSAPLPKIIRASFHTEDNGKILECEASIAHKNAGGLYISKLTPITASTYFSLPWELQGTLKLKGSATSEITISKIGGDFLSFYVDADQFLNKTILENTTSVAINFLDLETIAVTGKVTKIIKIGLKYHCDFSYLNILESTRDKIFRQIFKRQAEFKKALSGLVL
ncbi:MAG: HD-GYP domain-containing protein [Bacillota bacterium]